MRKPGFILFFLLGSVYWAQAQHTANITIDVSNVPLNEVLNEISRQSGADFSFNPQQIDPQQTISYKVKNARLERALTILCKKINSEYTVIEGQIILKLIKEKDLPLFYTLSGFVGDKTTGESLIGASVSISGTPRGVFTNAFGYYSIQLEAGPHELVYSYVGYELEREKIELKTNVVKNLSLKSVPIDLPDVIIGLSLKTKLESRHAGEKELKPNELLNMPEFAGESGLVKGLQSLPGVKIHSDGSAFFYVRGGERDQNLVIIDDAPIYNPSHLFGFYSTVIPDFAKSIKVYKSDIPTDLGDRLSSIVSIRTKDGNLNKFEFSGAINPLINRFSIETPIVKKKGSILVSWRRSNFEWLYRKTAPESKIGFGDFNFKWNHKLNRKNRIFFTTIFSGDSFTNSVNNTGIGWANFAMTLRWNHIFGPKLFSNTTIYTGNYGYRLSFANNIWQSGIGTLSFKTDFTHYLSPQYKAKFGLESQGYFINPGIFTLDPSIGILPEINANSSRKFTLYYQGTYEFSKRLKARAGLRMVNWSNQGPATWYRFDENHTVQDTVNTGVGEYHNYLKLDPRFSIQYDLDSTSQLKSSFGWYHQYLQLISNSESPFTSFEVWLPASPNIKPQAAWQLDLSYLKYLTKPKLELTAAVYYKKYFNQIDYRPHPTTLLNPLIEGELRFGSMHSYGLELMLKKELGRLNGWVGYTYSRVKRNTPGLNNDADYPAFQDRPHDFSMMLNYRLKRRTFLSAYLTIFSGSTFSAPTGFYTYNDQTIPIFDEKNNGRLPSYQRLDLAIKFILNKNPEAKYKHSLTFSVYNFLAHKNILFVNFNKIPRDDAKPVVKANLFNETALTASQTDLIRFFPSLTYKFKL